MFMLRFLSSRFTILVSLFFVSSQLIAATDNRQVGTVLAARGSVTTQKGRILKRNDHFNLGDEIRTASKSTAQLRLQDGSLVTLNENSTYTVEYLNSADSKDKNNISRLINGSLLWLGGPNKSVRRVLKTQVVSIALRGTSVGIHTSRLNQNAIKLDTTTTDILTGAVDICRKANSSNPLDVGRCIGLYGAGSRVTVIGGDNQRDIVINVANQTQPTPTNSPNIPDSPVIMTNNEQTVEENFSELDHVDRNQPEPEIRPW